MALPSAQLGSLASLNVPSYIPTTVVPKEQAMWKQLLMSVLAQTAGKVAGQGVENAMSRDSAAEFGQTPATGFDKLVSGPKVNERQATSLRAERSAKESQMRGIAADANTTKYKALQDLLLKTSDLDARAASEGLANTRNDADLAQREREFGGRERGIRAQQLLEGIKVERERLKNQREERVEKPERTARTRKLDADAEMQENLNRMMTNGTAAENPLTNGSAKPPTDALKKHVTTAAPQSEEAAILGLTEMGLTPEEIVEELTQQKTPDVSKTSSINTQEFLNTILSTVRKKRAEQAGFSENYNPF